MSLLFVISSCTSLDVDPIENDLFQPDFSNVDDIDAVLQSAYSGLKSANAYTGLVIAEGEWPADNLKLASTNTGQGAIDHEWDYEEGSQNFEAIWSALYTVIRRANFVITNTGNVPSEDAAAAAIINAQALVVRALAHYELTKLYGEDYNGGSGLAVPFITDPNDIMQQQSRITYSEMFNLLKADLTTAVQNIGDSFNPNFANAALAHGLMARIALIEEDWNGVISASTSAISVAPPLSGLGDYNLMFGENDEDGEAIFKLALEGNDGQLNDPFYADGVGARFDPSDDLVNLIPTNDVRYNANFGMIDGVLSIFKYRGSEANRDLHEPFIMRTSELYLLRAEANARLDQDGAARNDLDILRANRIPDYMSLGESGDDLDQAIRVERRIELAYEGFRFHDLKRWGMDVIRTDCTSDECTLERSNAKFNFPIPRAEIFANDNMQQNGGY